MNKTIVAAAGALLVSAAAVAAVAADNAAGYTADAQQSCLEFTGVQAGADFKGVFHKFTASVEFAPDA